MSLDFVKSLNFVKKSAMTEQLHKIMTLLYSKLRLIRPPRDGPKVVGIFNWLDYPAGFI